MGVGFDIIMVDFRLVQECRVDRGWLSKNISDDDAKIGNL